MHSGSKQIVMGAQPLMRTKECKACGRTQAGKVIAALQQTLIIQHTDKVRRGCSSKCLLDTRRSKMRILSEERHIYAREQRPLANGKKGSNKAKSD